MTVRKAFLSKEYRLPNRKPQLCYFGCPILWEHSGRNRLIGRMSWSKRAYIFSALRQALMPPSGCRPREAASLPAWLRKCSLPHDKLSESPTPVPPEFPQEWFWMTVQPTYWCPTSTSQVLPTHSCFPALSLCLRQDVPQPLDLFHHGHWQLIYLVQYILSYVYLIIYIQLETDLRM